MTNVRYIGSSPEVTIPGVAKCQRGEYVSVPAAIAGSIPDPRLAQAMDELVEATSNIDHETAAALKDEIATLDHGSGLLAQPEVWELVAQPKPKKPKTGESAETPGD